MYTIHIVKVSFCQAVYVWAVQMYRVLLLTNIHLALVLSFKKKCQDIAAGLLFKQFLNKGEITNNSFFSVLTNSLYTCICTKNINQHLYLFDHGQHM